MTMITELLTGMKRQAMIVNYGGPFYSCPHSQTN
jgi:hypothetical protein